MNKKIMVFGDTNVDLIVPYGGMLTRLNAIKEGDHSAQDTPVPKAYFLQGGGGGNVAAILGALGGKPYFLTRVGNDSFGDYCVGELEACGVDMSRASRDFPTKTFLLAVLDQKGEKVMMQTDAPGVAVPSFGTEDFKAEYLEDIALLHLTGTEFAIRPDELESTIEYAKLAKEKGVTVSLDLNLRPESSPMTAEKKVLIEELMGYCDIIFGSVTDEFMILTEETDALKAASHYAASNNIVVAREGGDPVILISKGEVSYHNTINLGPILSTVGAGDSFTAGFLTDYLEHGDAVRAVKAGNAVAGYAITHAATHVVPKPERIEELIAMQN